MTDLYAQQAHYLAEKGLYAPAHERDACGVGFVAATDGIARRDVVEKGIEALRRVWHRGAIDADGKTGDGAGIHLEIPRAFFDDYLKATGHTPKEMPPALGMMFLPRTDLQAQELCRTIVESEIIAAGYGIYGWRQVPVNADIIGEKANATRPEIEQLMVRGKTGETETAFEAALFALRRRIEKKIQSALIQGFYICSLSTRSIVYKGMFLAEQLVAFYPDLQDERFISRYVIYHQRYSTNTFPTWSLAQPLRMLAHNGEINTLNGNARWISAHEPKMKSAVFADAIEDLKPLIQPGSSDSAALDAVYELLCRAGRAAPLVQALLIPESTDQNKAMPQSVRDFFHWCNSIMEPWDGPAAVCATDGRWIVAGLDRNGLRPLRYTVSKDGILAVGSETGMVDFAEADIVEKGRLSPGGIMGVDLENATLYHDAEMKEYLSNAQDWSKLIAPINTMLPADMATKTPVRANSEELLRALRAFDMTLEDMDLILRPMGEEGKEAIGSMGDDTPLAVLSARYRGLHHYFRQMFSQVTNPPIDSLRERAVMSLTTLFGNLNNILAEEHATSEIIRLESPILSDATFRSVMKHLGKSVMEIDCTFDPDSGPEGLRAALDAIITQAEEAVRGGRTHLVLSDTALGQGRAAVPMILATSAVHSHMIAHGLRTFTSINVRTAECFDVHYVAVLIGIGATTVNPWLAEATLCERHGRGLLGSDPLATCLGNYHQALNQGLLKIMSKMGIGVVSAYRGGCNFEIIGLSRALVMEFFPGMSSRISGIGLRGLWQKIHDAHKAAYDDVTVTLPVGGYYRYRAGGESHGYDGTLIHVLQSAVGKGAYTLYKKYAAGIHARDPIHLRDLLGFRKTRDAINVAAVQSVTELRKKLVSPGISLGALSPEAHETLSIAMNRIGARSDSGEGGEDVARYTPRANGDNPRSAIKQVASGRFGVTAEYLNNCQEIEIKMAQGAKPGEGGQLPGTKVTVQIARLRHSTPGVTLISPPPHHDIYSIEDLAQLIYDLKQINPDAEVCVKLVARAGVGTIAAGVAKAKADVILISGHDGGTGASPQSSIKYAGLPWEMGLAEVNQVLCLNRLRQNVRLRVDGGLKTGRDIVIAALLGAEEFGIGTSALVAMGCIMVRQCHSNTCPVGVCTQDEALRAKFDGTPEKVVNLFSFLAEEVREILAELGFAALEEIIGRSDLLHQVSRGPAYLDMNALLVCSDTGGGARYCTRTQRVSVPDTLDADILRDAEATIIRGEKMQLTYSVRNTHRSIGARTSSAIVRRFGMKGLPPGTLTVRLRGSAGQSLGAFGVQGLKLEVLGDANDYVGKGLSGAEIVVRPPASSTLQSNNNTIIGNTVLYGATSGRLFAAGQAGERFCVRNSGALSVVEGCGSNGCEYMTGGEAVILGSVGPNFGAGMTGGMAFVYDPVKTFSLYANGDSIHIQRLETDYWNDHLRSLIKEHVRQTGSRYAQALLNDWGNTRAAFWQIVPMEMLDKLDHPVSVARRPTDRKTA